VWHVEIRSIASVSEKPRNDEFWNGPEREARSGQDEAIEPQSHSEISVHLRNVSPRTGF